MASDLAKPAVELKGVRKEYPGGVLALRGIDLAVAPGEVVALIGPSGCGKSTLLRCINGLESIESGEIWLNGERIDGGRQPWSEVRQRVGMVFQSYELFPHLDVLGNLLLAPTLVQRREKTAAVTQAKELLARVGLADKAEALPRELSGGQKQRVAIVRALMMNPAILLLDEITASLDPEIVREVLDVVAELAAEGMTMLIVTHELAFARAVADRVVFMDAGNIVEQGEAREIFERPKHDRTRRFLRNLSYLPED